MKIRGFLLSLLLFSFLLSWAQTTLDRQMEKFSSLMRTINYNYVDTINNENLVESAIVSVLEELDPHSVYIPKEELERMNEPLVGNFDGIGIQFNILRDTITVVSPISGGPSEKLGIISGDKIIKIEGEMAAGVGITNTDVMKKLRGKKGTKVNVSIARSGNSDLIDYHIIRDKIPIFSVDASYMVTPKIGYMKVNRFARKTNSEMAAKLEELNGQGLEHLILDLRGNGGGYLETAFKMADEFLNKDKLIVYTKGERHVRQEYNATSKGAFEKGKLVILVDEGSASASEIVAGAVQDWDRGLIVGRKSFGKGLVQKPYVLPDGSVIRLTTARYFTPSGRCIQKPYDKGKKEYREEISQRFEKGEVYLEDSITFPDSLKYRTKGNRLVFGGGGIMPDIFVPLDTMSVSDYYSNLLRKGLFSDFVLTYLGKERENLKSTFPKFKKFNSGFDAEVEILEDFIAYAEEQGVERVQEDIEKSKKLINRQLKSLIARNLWTTSEFFQVFNQEDQTFRKAVSAIEDDTFSRSKLSYK